MTQMKSTVDPRDVATYSPSDVSFFFDLPLSTARAWIYGQKNFKPLTHLPQSESRLVSFFNLVELHVISFTRRKRNLNMDNIRRAINFLSNTTGQKYPLAHESFKTDGIDIFIEQSGVLLNISRGGQIALREMIDRYLERVEYDLAGMPKRLYLFTRADISQNPKTVMIDPGISFGRPVIAGTGITTAIIFERFTAGESLQEIAIDYDSDQKTLEEAIRIEKRRRVA